MRKRAQTRLTPEDWAQAALAAIARGGIEAVAVEPLASELGATKGSFYWHFENRDALIESALERWAQRTEDVIDQLERVPAPAERLRLVMEGGFKRGPTERVEISLLANPGHPAAVRVMRRVGQRRVGYLCDQLEALGWEPQDAHDRAVLLSYIYVGHMQLAHIGPNAQRAESRRRQVKIVFKELIERH